MDYYTTCYVIAQVVCCSVAAADVDDFHLIIIHDRFYPYLSLFRQL